MARHNYVSVIAFVKKEPDIKNVLDGRAGIVGLTTIMSPRDAYKSKTGYQCNSVNFCARTQDKNGPSAPEKTESAEQTQDKTEFKAMTQEKKIVDIMADLKLFDIVELNGFLATKEENRSKECPFCHAMNNREDACVAYGNTKVKSGGNRVFVYPISMRIIKHCENEQEAYEFLHEYKEDVNRVFVIGNLTGEPIYGELQGGRKIYTRYQLAINRKYHPKGGSELYDRTDYPWVYSYQKKAEEDFVNLEKGALVFVDGALQSRKYKEQYRCSQCGQEYDVPGKTLEILSYDTEYLRLPVYDSKEKSDESKDE